MPIQASPETLNALGGGLLPRCENRSLFQDRFADPQASDRTTPKRIEWFGELTGNRKKAMVPCRTHWYPPGTETLHARLMSRMMVNLAGGVMENANVLLDRHGLPSIPGSAVKACARRMALQALRDWVAGDPETDGTEDIGRPCRIEFTEPADMLAAIARVFGWVGQDWSTGREGKDGPWKSDLAWASGGDAEILKSAKEKAGNLDSFAGTVDFLPASPNADPGLELDVVTPHHAEYYQSTDPNAKAAALEHGSATISWPRNLSWKLL